MKSSVALLEIQTLALALICAGNLSAGQVAAIEGPASADFGLYPAKEAKSASFSIVNKGDAPLKILGVRNVCDCVEAEIPEKELTPGEKLSFKAMILPDSVYGRYSKPVYIKTDDPANKFLSIALSGEAIPILKTVLEPEIYAGHLKLGASWLKEIDLEATKDGVETGSIAAECALPVKTSISKLSSRAFKLKIEIFIPEDKIGPFLCKIQIPVSKPDGWKPVGIAISGFAGAELAATPSKILMPKGNAAPSETKVELRLIAPDGKPLLRTEDIAFSAPAGVSITLSEKSPGVVIAKLEVQAGIHPDGKVEFKTQGARPLSLPIGRK